MSESIPRAYFEALPKIELHRHLEGAIRLETLVDVARQYDLDLPAHTVEGLRSHVQIIPGDAHDAAHFMQKFIILRRFFCAPEVIQRVAREAVIDAALDNIKYMELRFTPNALARLMGYTFSDVTEWVCDAVDEAQAEYDIKVRLIVSMNRHESVREGEKQMHTALQFKKRGIVGLDLCGHEAGYPAHPFYDIFREARQEGMGITIHAGEWDGPRNVRDAIEQIGAHRIGHGVRIVEDSAVTQLALDTGMTFEVCPTSNMQSGVVYAAAHHPLLDMNYIGLNTTINTDDPSISNIRLSDELAIAANKLGMSIEEIRESILRGAQAAFLPTDEHLNLIQYFESALSEPISVSALLDKNV